MTHFHVLLALAAAKLESSSCLQWVTLADAQRMQSDPLLEDVLQNLVLVNKIKSFAKGTTVPVVMDVAQLEVAAAAAGPAFTQLEEAAAAGSTLTQLDDAAAGLAPSEPSAELSAGKVEQQPEGPRKQHVLELKPPPSAQLGRLDAAGLQRPTLQQARMQERLLEQLQQQQQQEQQDKGAVEAAPALLELSPAYEYAGRAHSHHALGMHLSCTTWKVPACLCLLRGYCRLGVVLSFCKLVTAVSYAVELMFATKCIPLTTACICRHSHLSANHPIQHTGHGYR